MLNCHPLTPTMWLTDICYVIHHVMHWCLQCHALTTFSVTHWRFWKSILRTKVCVNKCLIINHWHIPWHSLTSSMSRTDIHGLLHNFWIISKMSVRESKLQILTPKISLSCNFIIDNDKKVKNTKNFANYKEKRQISEKRQCVTKKCFLGWPALKNKKSLDVKSLKVVSNISTYYIRL